MMSASAGSASNTIEQAGSINSSSSTMCTGISSSRPVQQGRHQRQRDDRHVHGEHEAHGLGDVVVDAPALADRATMLAKLSSSSTSAAASRATSVPRSPIAMPTSAAFSAGASLTPSPVIATTSPSALQQLHQAQLLLGLESRAQVDMRRRSRSAASSSAVDLRAGDHLGALAQADLARDGARRGRVVASHHDDADAGARHSAIAAGTSGRGGSDEAHQAEELEVEVVLASRPRRTLPFAAGHAEHAQAALGHRLHLAQDRRALGIGQVAQVDHRLGRALGGQQVRCRARRRGTRGSSRGCSGDSAYSSSGAHSACTCSVSVSQRRPNAGSPSPSDRTGRPASPAWRTRPVRGTARAVRSPPRRASCRRPGAIRRPACGSASACRSCPPPAPRSHPALPPRARGASAPCCLEIRHAPSARNTVRITGISSGRIAMASAMPASTLSSRPCPSHSQPSRAYAVASSKPADGQVADQPARRPLQAGHRLDGSVQRLADAADRGGAGDGAAPRPRPRPWWPRCWRTAGRVIRRPAA